MGEIERRLVTVGAIQCALGADRSTNIARVTGLIERAAAQGAQIILPPELFEGPYFCREEKAEFFDESRPFDGNVTLAHFARVARELNVVLPISFFERAGSHHYNSVAIIDADGAILGVYRKSHIPDGPGYEEKFYFRPGDTGFRVWNTKHAVVGVGICWDQWFPECARAMTLLGAEALFYPTAIGSEPHEPSLDTKDPWQRVMIGHAVANVIPVVAANRVGVEGGQTFYGSSFIANPRGDKVAELTSGGSTEATAAEGDGAFLTATFDLAEIRRTRAAWGFFRDRRPELYGALVASDPLGRALPR